MNTLNDTIQNIIDEHFQRVAFEKYEDDLLIESQSRDESEDWDNLQFSTE